MRDIGIGDRSESVAESSKFRFFENFQNDAETHSKDVWRCFEPFSAIGIADRPESAAESSKFRFFENFQNDAESHSKDVWRCFEPFSAVGIADRPESAAESSKFRFFENFQNDAKCHSKDAWRCFEPVSAIGIADRLEDDECTVIMNRSNPEMKNYRGAIILPSRWNSVKVIWEYVLIKEAYQSWNKGSSSLK